MNDPGFLDELRSGSPSAFRRLVEEHQDKVVNVCFGYLRSREDAEDCAQEVFIEVHGGIADFRGDSSVSTWLYRIAVTKSLDMIRRRSRRKRFAMIRSLFELQEEQGFEPEARKDHYDPAHRLEESERHKVLRDAVAKLPGNQRTAVILTKFEELSNQEAAEVMKISVSALEALNHRAVTALRKMLTEYHEAGA